MNIWGYLAICALLPLVCEIFARRAEAMPGRHPTFFLLTPAIGFFFGLGIYAHLPQPYLALMLAVLCTAGLVIISNLKLKVLRMVYAAQDVENLRHFFIYPDFYLSHVPKIPLIAGMTALATATALLATTAPFRPLLAVTGSPIMNWVISALAWWVFFLGLMRVAARILHDGNASRFGIARRPNPDMAKFGLFGSVMLHSILLRDKKPLVAAAKQVRPALQNREQAPHIVSIQGESFFDLTRFDSLVAGAPTPFKHLEKIRNLGAQCDQLQVPCWGAYTMQSEMAFLSGIAPDSYGTAYINPYRALASKQPVSSLASQLRAAGYRTIAVHPARPEFFRRHHVMPLMGFDSFIDLNAFSDAQKFGPYVSDEALFQFINEMLEAADGPTFIHAITIESHGPWEKGRLAGFADEAALHAKEHSRDASFAIFRKHMENLLAGFENLINVSQKLGRNSLFALYGDHQPAFPDLFDMAGFNSNDVDYILATSGNIQLDADLGPLSVENLADAILNIAGLHPES